MAQTFAIVEQLERGLCVEEAGEFPTVMIGSTNPPRDPPSGRPSQPPSRGSGGRGRGGTTGALQPMAAISAVEDDPQAPAMKYWGCGEEGHTKRECPNKPPPSQLPVPRGGQAIGRGGRGGKGLGKPTLPLALLRPSAKGTGVGIRCAYPPCSKPGHTEAQCWMKYPHLRPLSFTTQGNGGEVPLPGGRTMEARMAELQDTLAWLVAASAQPTPGASGF